MTKGKVDVIITVNNPGKKFFKLLDSLADQTVIPEKIVLMNVEDGEEENKSEALEKRIYRYFGKRKLFGKLPLQLEIVPVKEKDYDAGNTRNLGAKHTTSPFLLFMKHDAVPADNRLIEELLWSLEGGAGMAYARHITGMSTGVLKTYTTMYDYPSKSFVRTAADLERIGYRAILCSNACSMYRRDVFEQQGGFAQKIIALESPLFAARLLKDGGKVAYCAEAKVYYAMKEDWMSQLRRKFDEGVVIAEHPRVFVAGNVDRDGARYVKAVLSYLWNQKYYFEILDFMAENMYKLAGSFLGRHHRWLRREWILKLTANKPYWSKR